jgi:hypothetical protein
MVMAAITRAMVERRRRPRFAAVRHTGDTMTRLASATAFAVLAAFSVASPAAAQAPRTDELVGRWGVAAYWNAADAGRTEAAARSACAQPYVISRGPGGGAMMFESFEGRPREMEISGRQIVAKSGDAKHTKDITAWTGRMLVFNYVDEEGRRKYGNMVFVRCGR